MKTKSLTQVCNITTGKLDANAGIPNGKYPFFTCAPDPLRIDTFAFDDDVVLLAGNNAQGNFHIQRFKGKFNAYQRTYVITARDGYDIDYVKYSLELSLQHLKRIAQGSQTKFLTMQILDSFRVVDIPYDAQRHLIGSIREVDSKISLNTCICAELETMAKTLYDYWFTQFDFPDENGKPYRSSGGDMVWNEQLKREIPMGWSVDNLYSIAEPINGLACQKYRPKESEAELPVVKIKEMHEGITADTEKVSASIPEKHKIFDGDILFSWSATLEVMYWFGGDAGLNQHIFKVVPINGFSKEYVYHQFSAYVINFVKMAEARKTTMGHITTDHLEQSRIALPPSEIIQAFSKIVAPIHEKIGHCQKENRELTKLRDWLLPMLMNGQAAVE
jgi:type I restriction enzyme S subunit